MVFGFFARKKPSLKLKPKQEVEVEFAPPEGFECFFTHVLEMDKKKVTLTIPKKQNQPYPCTVGEPVTVTYMIDDVICSFQSRVLDKRNKEIDIALPKEVSESKSPATAQDFTIEIPIPVEYRAISTAHLQTATTKLITGTGVTVITNLPIPQETILHLELEIPNSPTIKTKGRVVKSQRLPADARKSLTEIEFEDINPRDKEALFRYVILYQQRRLRKQQAEQG